MTPEERQSLREKHRQYGSYCFTCGYWNEEVGDYDSASYPCDVIKVLDAYEALTEYHDHDGDTDREDPWCRTCWKPYPCEKGKALGHPDGADV